MRKFDSCRGRSAAGPGAPAPAPVPCGRPPWPRHPRLERLGLWLAAGYLVALIVLEVLRRTASWPDPDLLASTPSGVARGDLPGLLTSALVVAGAPFAQILGTAVTAVLVIRRLGARVFWVTALVSHVGATLIAYLGVGVLWLVTRGSVDPVVDQPDYGISCVWAGAVGALLAALLAERRPRTLAAVATGVGLLLALVPPAEGLAAVEHGLAFVLGALTAGLLTRRRAARAVGGVHA